MPPNCQFSAYFVTFNEEIINTKLHFLCAVLCPTLRNQILHEPTLHFPDELKNPNKNYISLTQTYHCKGRPRQHRDIPTWSFWYDYFKKVIEELTGVFEMDVHFKMIILKRGFLTNELRVTIYFTSYELHFIYELQVTIYSASYELLIIAGVTSYFLHKSCELLLIAPVTS